MEKCRLSLVTLGELFSPISDFSLLQGEAGPAGLAPRLLALMSSASQVPAHQSLRVLGSSRRRPCRDGVPEPAGSTASC